jgi:hypothetical protein
LNLKWKLGFPLQNNVLPYYETLDSFHSMQEFYTCSIQPWSGLEYRITQWWVACGFTWLLFRAIFVYVYLSSRPMENWSLCSLLFVLMVFIICLKLCRWYFKHKCSLLSILSLSNLAITTHFVSDGIVQKSMSRVYKLNIILKFMQCV